MLKSIREYLRRLARAMWLENKYQLLSLLEVNSQAKVLDIGCGDGSFTRMIADRSGSSHILGMEINQELARQAYEINHIDAVIADASKKLPFSDRTFDLVVANQLIEHLSDTDMFVKEVYRILRGGGICICSTMNLASFHNIVALALGYQPFTSHVSDEADCGTLVSLRPRNSNPHYGEKHRRAFTTPALKELFELHSFRCESLVGFGSYPLPLAIGRYFRLARYSTHLTIKVSKPSKGGLSEQA